MKDYTHNHTGSTHAFHATVGQIGPNLGSLGLYIGSKERSKSEETFRNLLVTYVTNFLFLEAYK